MAEFVITSFADTPDFKEILTWTKEKLAQHILVQRCMIGVLIANQTNTQELDALRDQLSDSNARIEDLNELLSDAYDIIQRFRDGDAVEWNFYIDEV